MLLAPCQLAGALGGRRTARHPPRRPARFVAVVAAAPTLAGYGGDNAVPILGVATCGMLCKAAAADLLLPLLFAGKRVTAGQIATLVPGGCSTSSMAFKVPPYGEVQP